MVRLGVDPERLGIEPFDAGDFGRAQVAELFGLRPFRETTLVLVEEAEQQVRQAIGHDDDVVQPPPEGVVAVQEGGLCRQVDIDRVGNTGIEKLGVGRGVEIAVEVGGLVKDPYIALGGGLPGDEGQDQAGMAFQRALIFRDAVKNGRMFNPKIK